MTQRRARRRSLRCESLENRTLLSADPGFLAVYNNSYANYKMADGIAADAAGNTYVAGEYAGTFALDGTHTLASAGDYDGYVAKYSPSGQVLWAMRFGGASVNDRAYHLAVNPNDGSLFVTGTFQNQADFGGRVLTSYGGYSDAFLMKLDGTTGDLVWVDKIGSADTDSGYDVATDGVNVYLAGGSFSTKGISFNGQATIATTAASSFVCKVNAATGSLIWGKAFAGSDGNASQDVSVTGDGSVYLAGKSTGAIQFARGISLTSRSASGDGFLVKLDSAGNAQWARGLGGTGVDTFNSLTADSSGNVYVAATFTGAVNYYTSANPQGIDAFLQSNGDTDGVVLKFAADGTLAAKVQIGGKLGDAARSIALDANRNQVVVAGYFRDALSLPGPNSSMVALAPTGTSDALLVTLNANLECVNADHVGGIAAAGISVIAVHPNSTIAAAGTFTKTAAFLNGEIRTATGDFDTFVIRTDPDQGAISGRSLADLNGDGIPDSVDIVPLGGLVYCDLNNDYAYTPDEPAAVLGATGNYTIHGLEYQNAVGGPVTYTVRQALPSGWTQESPVAAQTVTLSPSNPKAFAPSDFINHIDVTTTSYTFNGPAAIKDNVVTSAKIAISDSYSIMDLNVTLNITHTSLADLNILLIAPSGTSYTLVSTGGLQGTAKNMSITFDDESATYRPVSRLSALDQTNINGIWEVRVYDMVKNRAVGTLNSATLTVVHRATAGQASSQALAAALADAAFSSTNTLADANEHIAGKAAAAPVTTLIQPSINPGSQGGSTTQSSPSRARVRALAFQANDLAIVDLERVLKLSE